MQGIQPVDVISLCDAEGELRPLRIRLASPRQERLRVDIDRILAVKSIPYAGIEAKIFLCEAVIGGRKRQFELKYTVRTHRWCMLREVY